MSGEVDDGKLYNGNRKKIRKQAITSKEKERDLSNQRQCSLMLGFTLVL